MMKAPAGERSREHPLGGLVAEQRARVTRVEALEPVGLGQLLDLLQRGRARHHGLSGISRRRASAQTRAATSEAASRPSTTTQRCGSASAMARKPSRRRSWKAMSRAS